MVLWIVLAFLTAAVAVLLMAPLMKALPAVGSGREDEAAVYRDQLREVDRDLTQGLIGSEEAEYARAEIGRRLLTTAQSTPRSPTRATRSHRLSGAMIILGLPAVGLCLYVLLGSPDLPAQPLEARLANPGANMSLLVAKAERHLAENPEDGAGWDLLAPIYFRSMRLPDAERAYRNAIRILGETPARLSGLGETLVAANDGVVVEAARDAFQRAAALGRPSFRVRFYLALGLEQAGKSAEALQAFEAIAKETPPGAAWSALVGEHIAKNGGTPPTANLPGNPDADAVAAAKSLAPAERQQMIQGMVDGLAAKLREDPASIEGWLRLVRSYKVLGQDDKAAEALATGLNSFPADGEPGKRLIELAREIDVKIGGATP